MKKRTRRTKIIKFIEIMKQILNVNILQYQQQFQDMIKWDDSGIKVLILDKELLSSTVLPKYFKHSNYASFLRQLNTYGFTSCREASNLLSYSHPAFTKDKVIRKLIKKKVKQQKQTLGNLDTLSFQYEELRDQMLQLKLEQDKINENLKESIACQMKIQASIKQMFITRMQIAYTGILSTKKITKMIKSLVSNMKPELQQSYSLFFTFLFPETVGQSERQEIPGEQRTQFAFSPVSLGQDFTPNIINFSPFLQYQEELNMNFCSFGFQQ